MCNSILIKFSEFARGSGRCYTVCASCSFTPALWSRTPKWLSVLRSNHKKYKHKSRLVGTNKYVHVCRSWLVGMSTAEQRSLVNGFLWKLTKAELGPLACEGSFLVRSTRILCSHRQNKYTLTRRLQWHRNFLFHPGLPNLRVVFLLWVQKNLDRSTSRPV